MGVLCSDLSFSYAGVPRPVTGWAAGWNLVWGRDCGIGVSGGWEIWGGLEGERKVGAIGFDGV